ncbi:hypothetical protein NC651_015503 [Populus alba x Populus x berolinensis]|nr:hypothetical protein NC651_015503 [Populus alba x Populus x berolinensis]
MYEDVNFVALRVSFQTALFKLGQASSVWYVNTQTIKITIPETAFFKDPIT